MPKRTDIHSVMLIGSGPIVIGQACEFDYSGTQAIKALKEEGYRVTLVNSNPATIMTDPELADAVYVEPINSDYLEKIILKERPDALVPTMGGQTALNVTMALHKSGFLEKMDVEILGANPKAIERAENRELFREAVSRVGGESARSFIVHNESEIDESIRQLGLPLVLRPSFTLGGEGGGIALTEKEAKEKIRRALFLSPTKQVLVEESLLGWKEFELEVVRDKKDNVIIVCSIENVDPMGVHTGDSITVAPALTLTDKEFQKLRDLSIAIIREIGVETGGSNIQFAVNPKNGRVIVIEMNPRVSRSSALASKATGFPIARVAAKLAVGYSLDELTNDITGTTPCSFEPTIDYIVVKIPRFDFEKFPMTDSHLGTQMKSVGEVMAIGRTFREAFGKALSSLEDGLRWLSPIAKDKETLLPMLDRSHYRRLWAIADAYRLGMTTEEIQIRTGFDPWFLHQIKEHIALECKLKSEGWPLSVSSLTLAKSQGWTDRALSELFGNITLQESDVRKLRMDVGLYSRFQGVDTCAAEFEARTPYFYSTYRTTDRSEYDRMTVEQAARHRNSRGKVMVLGGGPNRIGQGIEFDYCCVHAAMAIRELGYECIMVNSNPETVSTDFDTSDRLYFEPLTAEHVLNIARNEKILGAIVQLGGQTPLKLSHALEQGGVRILGTPVAAIDAAEDREQCAQLVEKYATRGLKQPEAATVRTRAQALDAARRLGYPLLVRPSYVLGGRGMRIVHSEEYLLDTVDKALALSEKHPILMDRYLEGAVELDVDVLADGNSSVVAGMMEHIEEAGIHSGDSACSLPCRSIGPEVQARLRSFARDIALDLGVIGLLNIQFAVKDDETYLLEINPRASRTVPFVSKAIGIPIAKVAVKLMIGSKLSELGITKDLDLELSMVNVKAPVFPFNKFPHVDILLGPEMKSTGESMGRAKDFPSAYLRAMLAAGFSIPRCGNVFLSIRDADKSAILPLAIKLSKLGFGLFATGGSAQYFSGHGLRVSRINKVMEGSPHCVEAILRGDFSLVINTVSGDQAIHDSFSIRRAALEMKIPYATVVTAAVAMVQAIEAQNLKQEVTPLEPSQN